MDELKTKKAVTESGTATTTGADYVNQMYDAQKQSQLNQLETAYNQSLSDQQTAASKIPETYNEQKNQLAAEYGRQQRSFNEQAALNGINTGAGSQVRLSQQNSYNTNAAAIGKAQADAQTAADKAIANLKASYQSQVAQAISDNDYNRAQALYAEWNNQADRDSTKAKTLAAYGDFSGYAALYGDDTARSMATVWNAQNPDLAYNVGNISADEHKAMTGSYPTGYKAQSSRSSSGSSGGDGSGTKTTMQDYINEVKANNPALTDAEIRAQARTQYNAANPTKTNTLQSYIDAVKAEDPTLDDTAAKRIAWGLYYDQ